MIDLTITLLWCVAAAGFLFIVYCAAELVDLIRDSRQSVLKAQRSRPPAIDTPDRHDDV